MYPSRAPEKKYAGLEVLRFLAALAVVVFHYRFFFAEGVWRDTVAAHQPFYHELSYIYENGYLAVQLFWVLSGFVFFYVYASRPTRYSAMDFFTLRLSRLYPLHVATLVVVAILQSIYVRSHVEPYTFSGNSPSNFLVHLGLASSWLESQDLSFNAPIWSVSTEVLVYAVFFTLTLSFSRSIAVTACALLAFLLLNRLNPTPLATAVFECGLFFYAGGLIFQVMQIEDGRVSIKVILALVLVTAAILLLLQGMSARLPTVRLLLWCGSLILLFALIDRTPLQRLARNFSWLGDLTYASYLIHFPVQLVMVITTDALGLNRSHLYESPALLVLYITIVFCLARVTNKYFEMPAQRAIRDAFQRLARRDPVPRQA